MYSINSYAFSEKQLILSRTFNFTYVYRYTYMENKSTKNSLHILVFSTDKILK